jgi:AcrR family transcriptional regulator
MPTQQERSEATIRALEESAQHLFETVGFAGTTIDAIVARAAVAKGAFYHHFRSKESIFAVVVDLLQARLARQVSIFAAKGTTPVARLRLGLRAYMTSCANPKVRRVLLTDGPSVLGWPRWREIDNKYFGEMTRRAVAAALGPSALAAHVQAVASLISGAFAEAAMLAAGTPDAPVEATALCRAMDVLLAGLETSAAGPLRKRVRKA